VSIHATYPTSFIETTDMAQQIQQFKLKFTFSSEHVARGKYS